MELYVIFEQRLFQQGEGIEYRVKVIQKGTHREIANSGWTTYESYPMIWLEAAYPHLAEEWVDRTHPEPLADTLHPHGF